MTFEGLLDAMLLPSGNDAAYTMACGVGRIVANDPTLPAADAVALFVELMNEKARELGCRDSHFANPDGFHHDDHYTTAYDMARIAVACMEIEPVAKSCSKTVGRAVFLSGEDVTWYSTNKLLGSYRYATGLEDRLDGRGRPLSCRFGRKRTGRSLWRFCSNRPTPIRATTMRPRFSRKALPMSKPFCRTASSRPANAQAFGGTVFPE